MSIPDASTYPPLPSWWSLIKAWWRAPRAKPSPEQREGVP